MNRQQQRTRTMSFRLTRYQHACINTLARENGITNGRAAYFLMGMALHQAMQFDTDGRRDFLLGNLPAWMADEWNEVVEKYLESAREAGVPF